MKNILEYSIIRDDELKHAIVWTRRSEDKIIINDLYFYKRRELYMNE